MGRSTGGLGWAGIPPHENSVNSTCLPAAQKATALKERHKFKTEMDAEAMQDMFPHLNVKVA